jgi:hypothetical protein
MGGGACGDLAVADRQCGYGLREATLQGKGMRRGAGLRDASSLLGHAERPQ